MRSAARREALRAEVQSWRQERGERLLPLEHETQQVTGTMRWPGSSPPPRLGGRPFWAAAVVPLVFTAALADRHRPPPDSSTSPTTHPPLPPSMHLTATPSSRPSSICSPEQSSFYPHTQLPTHTHSPLSTYLPVLSHATHIFP